MTSTLLLRLHGPMQSYGIESRFEFRETTLEPTKSGVIGIICNVLGRDRSEAVDDLVSGCRMAVRVDDPGRIDMDYQTALDIISAQGSVKVGESKFSYRYYLHDADFLVALQSDDTGLLRTVHQAFLHPVHPPFLGRKSCPPSIPVVTTTSLMEGDAGMTLPDAVRRRGTRVRNRTLRYVVDADLAPSFQGLEEVARMRRHDVPVSYRERLFRERDVVVFTTPAEPLGGVV